MNAVAETLDRPRRAPITRSMANALRMLADRCGRAGELRPSRHADGHGRDRRRAVGPASEAQSAPIPHWPDRDRFVLSNGHGSMLLYALLHLTGYDLPIDELKRFRQLALARRRAIPKCGVTPGVETTTGPLGQGFANAVGMALAEKLLAREFNRPGHDDRRSPHAMSFVGDGCLMEGISHEAGSLAGTLGLGKLDRALRRQRHLDRRPCRELVHRRYADALRGLRLARRARRRRPRCRRRSIARCDRRARSATADADLLQDGDRQGRAHRWRARTTCTARRSAPTRPQRRARRSTGRIAPFEIPASIAAAMGRARAQARRAEADWKRRFDAYRRAYPAQAAEFERRASRRVARALGAKRRSRWCAMRDRDAQSIATRKASQLAIEGIGARVARIARRLGRPDGLEPHALEGRGAVTIAPEQGGNYMHLRRARVRHEPRCMNGIALHRRLSPVRRHVPHVLRLLAQRAAHGRADEDCASIFVFTHDSIGLGEDGPTHQPVEHAATLRLIPDLDVWRPCDTVETAQRVGPRSRARDRPIVPVADAPEPAVRHARRRRADRSIRARRLRAGRRPAGGKPRSRADRDRLRSGARARRHRSRLRDARHRCARRLDALDHRVRPRRIATTGATRCCPTACRASRSRPASRVLAAIRRPRRRRGRHRPLRRIRTRRRAVRAFRLHRRRASPMPRPPSLADRLKSIMRETHGSHLVAAVARSRGGARLRRAGLQRQQHGADPGDHAGRRGDATARSSCRRSAGARKYAGEPFLRHLVRRGGRDASRIFPSCCIRITARARRCASRRSARASPA